MKISKLIKILVVGAVAITGSLAIGLFCNVNTIKFPTVNILTSSLYNQIKSKQNNENNKNVFIDYASLPGTNYSILDVLKGTRSISNGNYMFYYGSDAYNSTAEALYGWDEPIPYKSYEDQTRSVDSLMLTLYDFFYNSENSSLIKQYGLNNISPTFLNYIDMSATRDTIDSQALLNDRMYNMPNTYFPEGNTENIGGVSKVWKIGDDVANPQYLPVVKNTNFDYRPNNSYYEFRPDNKEDTKYQKIYFRNQDVVRSFQLMGSLCEKIANELGVAFNKEGTLFLIRYANNSWSYSSITSFNDVETNFKNIIKFYNPDIKLDDDEIVSPDNNNSSGGNDSSSSQDSQQFQITTRKVSKIDWKNVNNHILISKKED